MVLIDNVIAALKSKYGSEGLSTRANPLFTFPIICLKLTDMYQKKQVLSVKSIKTNSNLFQ
jgi:hypothetical protein